MMTMGLFLILTTSGIIVQTKIRGSIMAYHFTKVPTQWSPSTLYELSNGIFLKPATRTAYANYAGPGATIYFDSMFFITSSETKKEHITKLKNWLFYHAFIFDYAHLCLFFELGLLQVHHQANELEEIQENGENNAYVCDYDDVGKQIYWWHTPSTQMSYKNLFLQYEELSESKRVLIESFLFTLQAHHWGDISYPLFGNVRKYWLVVQYAAVLEGIIGHTANCALSEVRACCIGCKKELQPHRAGSEKQWRRDFLSNIGMNQEIQKQYLKVINTAYDEIRHKTAHPSKMPTPQYPTIVGTEEYDIARSIKNFPTDTNALDALLLLIEDVTRYLLLNHVFSLTFFPHLQTLKATHIGG